MVLDRAGDTMRQARGTALQSTFVSRRDRVGSPGDRVDYYRIRATSRSQLTLRVRGSHQGVLMRLIDDRNGDRQLSTGEVMRQRRSQNNSLQTVKATVDPGIYFLQIRPLSRRSSRFTLQVRGHDVPTTPEPDPSPGIPTILQDVLRLTNQQRQQNGLSALRYDNQLASAAQTHTQNMALQDFFSHTGLDNSQPWDRVNQTGYSWSRVTENIAAGQRTAEQVVNGWMNSPGHRANILDPNVQEIGLGHYYLSNDTGDTNYNHYWTQVFAKPR